MTSSMTLALWLPLAVCLLHHALLGDAAASQQDSGHDPSEASAAGIKERSRRASSFVRIGKPSNFVRIGRANSFVRIGKDLADKVVGFGDLDEAEPGYSDFDKRLSNFVRIGKRHPMHRFIRIGRMSDSDSFPLGYDEADKRASSFVRIGKSDIPAIDDDGYMSKRASKFVRIGKGQDMDMDNLYALPEILKRASHFVRIGKGASNFVRIGRGPSSFVRIGKSDFGLGPDSSEGMDKRVSSFVRIGKNFGDSYGEPLDLEDPTLIKRPSKFVRIGKDINDEKRASSFVRIGKDLDHSDVSGQDAKRVSSFVRIGKSDNDKRASSFVRIGRNSEDLTPTSPDEVAPSSATHSSSPSSEEVKDENLSNDKPINLANRGSAFVRIGKIPSSAFVRIGKNTEVLVDPLSEQRVGYRRGSRGGQSNFVRIG